MLVLDTDHLVEFDRGSAAEVALQQRLEDAADEVATTIISAEEQFRGRLAQIHICSTYEGRIPKQVART